MRLKVKSVKKAVVAAAVTGASFVVTALASFGDVIPEQYAGYASAVSVFLTTAGVWYATNEKRIDEVIDTLPE